jgi:hypothetical protein
VKCQATPRSEGRSQRPAQTVRRNSHAFHDDGEVRRVVAGRPATTGAVRGDGGVRGTIKAVDGPFAEAKELVGGYAVLEVRSKAEAVELARRLMQIHKDHWPGWEGSCEVRQLMES